MIDRLARHDRIARQHTEGPDYRVCHAFVRECAAGRTPPDVPPDTASFLRRWAPLAVVVNDFYVALHGESRKTPYPEREIAQLLRTHEHASPLEDPLVGTQKGG